MLEGLEVHEQTMTAGEFFDAIPWDEPAVDPEMPSQRFLDAL
jgi:hypothetical protein